MNLKIFLTFQNLMNNRNDMTDSWLSSLACEIHFKQQIHFASGDNVA